MLEGLSCDYAEIMPGLDAVSDDYRPAGSSQRMDLATAAWASATHMGVLWAGWSSWLIRARATPYYWTDDYATAGSGQTRQSEARDSELLRASQRGM